MRSFSASLLVGLFFSPNGGVATIQHLDPANLEPTGPKIELPTFNYLHAVEGRVAVWSRKAVEVVDTVAVRVDRSYPFTRRDVCAVELDDHADPVVLVGCTGKGPRHYALIHLRPRSRTTVAVKGYLALPFWPTDFAYGDGKLFVVRGSGEVDIVDGATGHLRVRPPPTRRLSKGGVPFVAASWLGEHQLGLNGAVVDVRTWKRRVLASHGREVDAAGPWLSTYGNAGVTVWTRDLHLYRRFLRGTAVDQAKIVNGVLYAQVALVWHRFDVGTGRSLGELIPDGTWQMRLL